MAKFEQDLTGGSVSKQLIKFSLPFLLSNFIQSIYNVADMWVVSRFSSSDAAAGVANGGQITFIVTNFVIGLTAGGTVLIGQYFGAKKHKDMKEIIGTLFSILLIMAVFLTISMILLSNILIKLVQVPPEAVKDATNYFVICMLGTVFIFGYNVVSSILRGMGDSKRPLIFVSIACVTNIILDLIFVGPLQMGAAGAALATIIAQALSLILSIIYLIKNKFVFDFKFKSFRIYKDKLKQILKIGLPMSFQNIVTGLSFLVMTILVNGYGVEASAAMGMVGKFNSFAILPSIAMSMSVSSMVAQNIGAELYDRAKKIMRSGMIIIFPVGVIFFIIAFLFPDGIMRIFTDETLVIEQGIEYIRFFSIDYLIVPFTFCLNGLITGSGHTTFTMINSMMSSVLFRVPIAILFGSFFGLGLMGIGLAAPVASFGACCISFIYFCTGRWKKTRINVSKFEVPAGDM